MSENRAVVDRETSCRFKREDPEPQRFKEEPVSPLIKEERDGGFNIQVVDHLLLHQEPNSYMVTRMDADEPGPNGDQFFSHCPDAFMLETNRNPELNGHRRVGTWKRSLPLVKKARMGSARVSTHFWTDEETQYMLHQLKKLDISKYMDGRKTRNGKLFKKVADYLDRAGFKRSPEQIRVRWKHLKQTYYNAKKNSQTGCISTVSLPYGDVLEDILGHTPLPRTGDNHVDVGFSHAVSEHVVAEMDLEETAEASETIEEPDEDEGSSESPERTPTPQRHRSNSPPPPSGSPVPDLPVLSAGLPSRRRRRHNADLELFFQRMQQMQNSWMEQIQRSQEREERLLSSILESNERVMSALMEGIHSLRNPAPPAQSQGPV
ncbi:uncharacterized protein KZ484_021858 isoform 1-T2 [Pholidichthys leucotaenia]